ncbi:RNA-binding protein [Duganella sp. CY15W]|uniref:RNA-binding protein n=1 Tax=Duganella sp. CY15W TaxID=2692172 RepID=UPI00136E6144|nr:RNA-binding protein [Duganella sp. CY15W]MYM28369.1 RNA-binding protein [Duganella sp. CY15W]
MQVILTGLHGDACEDSVAQGLALYFHVKQVSMVRQGDNDSPWALIEVADSYERVWSVCNQLRGVFHRGKAIHLYIPLHQEDVFHDLEPHQRIDIA